MHRRDHKPLLYGRKNEIAYLQGIVASVLQRGDFIVPDHSSSIFSAVDTNKVECGATVPTETSHCSDEDSSANDTIAGHPCKELCNIGSIEGCSYHFVLVSGPVGAGKRSLALTALNQSRSRKHGSPYIFVSERFQSPKKTGSSFRFNSSKRMSPRRPFRVLSAIRKIVHITLMSTELSDAVEETLKVLLNDPDDVNTLCELLPGVRKWLQGGAHSPDSTTNSDSVSDFSYVPTVEPGMHCDLQPTQALVQVLRKFLHAVVSFVPVVLLLENLQDADEASLALVKSLLTANKSSTDHQLGHKPKGMMIIATYTEVDGAMPPLTMISSLENPDGDEKKPFKETEMSNECASHSPVPDPITFSSQFIHQIIALDLSWDNVNEWVHASGGFIQQCSAQQKIEITNLVFHHSNGNPMHIRYILQYLEHDESLFQEPIHKKRIPCKMDELFGLTLLREDRSLQKVVQVTALLAQYCEGGVSHNVLEIALNVPCLDIIETAHLIGLIECSVTGLFLYFCQESFRKAAYNSISDVSLLYLDVGRSIWRNAILSQDNKTESKEDVIDRVLLSTLLLRNCIALLSDIDERIYMSQLCYETGQKSSSLGDFRTSSKLFEFAICVLDSELWRSDLYEASLVLHNAAAQSYCSIGDYDSMQKILDDIFDRASTFQDKLPGYVVLLYAYASQNKLLDLFRTASMVLCELGEPINPNPGTLAFMTHLFRTKLALRGKDDRFFSDFPEVENAEYFILTQLLSLAMYHSYIFKPIAGLVLCFRLVRLSLKHGVTGPSLHAFTCYAFFLCMNGDFDEGYRIGQLALKFADRCGAWWPRINVLVYGRVNPWTCPFRLSIEPLNRARLAALTYGDLDMNASASFHYLITSLSAGTSLLKLKMATQLFCEDIAASGQMTQLLSILPLWSLITSLIGEEETLDLGGAVNDASSALKHCIKEGNKFMAGNFYAYRTMWYCLIGDYDEALQMAKKTLEQRQMCDYTLTFYEGLAALACSWNSTSCLHHNVLRRGKRLTKCIKRWADRCPANFRNKQWLLEAEIAALQGKSSQALSLFEQSIAKAKHEGFFHEKAIAFERLGQFQRHIGNLFDAKTSFKNAQMAYGKWGASILVDRMNDLLSST